MKRQQPSAPHLVVASFGGGDGFGCILHTVRKDYRLLRVFNCADSIPFCSLLPCPPPPSLLCPGYPDCFPRKRRRVPPDCIQGGGGKSRYFRGGGGSGFRFCAGRLSENEWEEEQTKEQENGGNMRRIILSL